MSFFLLKMELVDGFFRFLSLRNAVFIELQLNWSIMKCSLTGLLFINVINVILCHWATDQLLVEISEISCLSQNFQILGFESRV